MSHKEELQLELFRGVNKPVLLQDNSYYLSVDIKALFLTHNFHDKFLLY